MTKRKQRQKKNIAARLAARIGLYQSQRYVVLRRTEPCEVSVDEPPLIFMGIGELARSTDVQVSLSNAVALERLAAGDSGIVAFLGNAAVGWLWLHSAPLEEDLYPGRYRAFGRGKVLHFFEVHKGLQGKGFGTAILRELTRRTQSWGPVIVAFVAESNVPSLRAFTRSGYSEAGIFSVRRVFGRVMKTEVAI